ncbi:MAG: S41 family peptidase [Candidatus Peribacteraceae bacterium]|nr:S41 family peptidase [Candidatus Peribacteraceae bacterium]
MMMSACNRFAATLLIIGAFVSASVPVALGARSVGSIVDVSAQTVSQATFIRWSMEALDLPHENESCTLPYKRYPLSMKRYLCSAQEKGALKVFGKSESYLLSRPVTRGEALIVLTALTGKNETADVSAFRDVHTDPEKQAVMNAVTLKWMTPVRTTMFGMERKLTGTEAKSVLESVTGNLPERVRSISVRAITVPASGIPHQDLLEAVWEVIRRDYLRKDTIDTDEAAYRAIEGLVDSLDDPYSNFFRPVSASDFQSQIKGEVSGIGAQVEERDGVLTVIAPLPGSPAERAGLSSGDEILEANGIKLTGLSVEKAVSYIRGERGTTVVLKVRRGSTEMIVNVVRDVISVPEIDVKWQGDIAVVQLTQFGETTLKRIRSVFQDVVKQSPRGIILDLRNNGGGLLSAADEVVSNFVPSGTVVAKVKSRTSTSEEVTANPPVVNASTKVVVLVNKGSASASEIVAGALQDLKRATIVGTSTFGKGTVQEVVGFTSGEALKLTVAEWLTPLGRTIEKIGIKPDIIVDEADRAEQLRRALDILR